MLYFCALKRAGALQKTKQKQKQASKWSRRNAYPKRTYSVAQEASNIGQLQNMRLWNLSKSFSFQWLLCGKLKLQCADNKLFKDL